jgi:hypothetical protein
MSKQPDSAQEHPTGADAMWLPRPRPMVTVNCKTMKGAPPRGDPPRAIGAERRAGGSRGAAYDTCGNGYFGSSK